RLFLPLHTRVSDALRKAGHIPSWDPAGFGGRPLVGNPQAGLWYPPSWLFWWLREPSLFGRLTVAPLIWSAFGFRVLAKRRGVCGFAAMGGAISYAINPYMLAQLYEGHYPHIWAACWYPWAFLAAWAWREGSVRGLIALPAILAMSLTT